MKYIFLLLSTLVLSCNTVSVIGGIDLNNKYPEVDTSIGVNYSLCRFENMGYVRFGAYVLADVNPDLSRPEWISGGICLSREIQRNVTIGAGTGYRSNNETQYIFFLGIDVWPMLRAGK